MSKKRQKRVVIKFYMSGEDRDANERSIGRPSVATTVAGLRKIVKRHRGYRGPFMAYFDKNGNNLGSLENAERYISQ